ncbi:carbon-nitrogen hydrolase family protein [Oceanomicrobium pacificus]|uniref:Carbon-nitrogen hydrolase family protein n=1 Tax=Oceanomicrobium pacificus TaxID=2692916 RepID=A0A6B0TQ05_9RHOB|nr:carbon-nitrogen hydrolase family protein [Oceanomicrobium pacificus]MXU64759.1 carbon-nitrogen hydrolase family protein [Oceanomicrobium pacificus]
MRAGLIQLSSGEEPAANITHCTELVREAAAGGAEVLLTPENSNLLTADRALQRRIVLPEGDDPFVAAMRELAADLSVWLLLGSVAVRGDDPDRHANRSLLIAPDGRIATRYDKIHMFDVTLGSGESYRESDAVAPGDRTVLAHAAGMTLGLTICYDLRFGLLYRMLAQAGAQILTVPSAFTRPTGEAHWEVLLRARAIETGSYVLAPAQCGVHRSANAPDRKTHGHSLAVDPWGQVIGDGGTAPGVTLVEIDRQAVDAARRRIPSLIHDRPLPAPEGV